MQHKVPLADNCNYKQELNAVKDVEGWVCKAQYDNEHASGDHKQVQLVSEGAVMFFANVVNLDTTSQVLHHKVLESNYIEDWIYKTTFNTVNQWS